MPANRPPIIQYWHSRPLPPEIAEPVSTIRDCNPELQHRLFCEAEATEFIAEHFTGREVAAFSACAIPAMQADYFRYCAVLALGGVYVDGTRWHRRPLHELLDGLEGGALFGREDTVARLGHLIVVNGFFAFGSPGHPFLALTLEIATANVESRISESVWHTTGPAIFTLLNLLRELGSFDALLRYTARNRLNLTAGLLCEVVGEMARVQQAFAGIRVATGENGFEAWLAPPAAQLAYRKESTDWRRVRSSIFR